MSEEKKNAFPADSQQPPKGFDPSKMPKDFDYVKTTSVKVVVDDDNYIWLYCDYGSSKEVWRGRINRLGWALR